MRKNGIMVLTVMVLYFVPFFGDCQKIKSDKTDVIDGTRFITTSDIVIDSKFSKIPIYVSGSVFIANSFTDPHRTIYFHFPVDKLLFFSDNDYAIIVFEDGTRIKPKYFGKLKLTGASSKSKYEYFGVDMWDSDMKSVCDQKVSAVRIVTGDKDFTFDVSEKEAINFQNLAKLLITIK